MQTKEQVLKENLHVGMYIGVTSEDGYFIGVLSKIRSKSFDVCGFLLSGMYPAAQKPEIHYSTFYFNKVQKFDVPFYSMHEYIAEELKHLNWKEAESNNSRQTGFTEDQLVEILENKGYEFFEYGVFDKNLFLNIAWDLYEYNDTEKLWYERDDAELQDDEKDFVYLCNNCDAMYGDELDHCEVLDCNGSIRTVSKGDVGIF